VNASVTDPPDPTDAVWVFPSQLLTVEVLRRPVESALGALIRMVNEPTLGRVVVQAAAPDGVLQRAQHQLGIGPV